MKFDPLYNPYPSRRMTIYARGGLVATSQPLAASAGLRALLKGGNAIDAAVATAAALTVVQPTSNGIGSDAFSLIWHEGQLHGLNASGPAPQGISPDKLRSQGHTEMPAMGWTPVTVPGAPSAWAQLSERFGRLSLEETLEPAVEYAEKGYPLSPELAHGWERAHTRYSQTLSGPEFAPWFDTFAPQGRPPRVGEIWRSPGHASTLRSIAETGAESFYRGALAEKIDAFSQKTGGYLRSADLESFTPQWVEPIGLSYRDHTVWEMPPNGQGLVALMAMGILRDMDLCHREDPQTIHRQIEAMKLAFTDGMRHITDPDHMVVAVDYLLSEDHLASRRALIGDVARDPGTIPPVKGGTVYLATADGEGNMVSYIQSNYMGFGSGVVIPETGISLQNRGHNFSLDPTHDNCLRPGKRTYHTIIPGFLTKEDRPVGPFGVMGGFMQPQGHLQVMMNALDWDLNPQACLDAPRWQWVEGNRVKVESSFPTHLAEKLSRMGHEVEVSLGSGGFGKGQIIWLQEDGVLAGGTEPRSDGAAMAF